MNLNLNIFPLLSSFVIIPTTLLASEALVIPQVLTVKLNQNYVNRCPWGSGSRWIDGYLNGKRFGRWDLTTREGCERVFTFNLESDASKDTGDTFYELTLVTEWYPNAPMRFNIAFPGYESRHVTFTFHPDGRPESTIVKLSGESPQNRKPSLINVALGKPSFVTGTYGSYASSNANDGNPTSVWNGGNSQACWTVDLQGIYKISTVVLSSNQFGNNGLKTVFQVSSSIDNKQWSVMGRPITASGDQSFTLSAGNSRMRYIRYCTLPSSTNWATLSELKAYGVPSGQ